MAFEGGARITQFFGVNHEYYSQFGNEGHEGIDLVPVNDNVTIYSVYPGQAKRIYMSDTYGLTVKMWYPVDGLLFDYCHLTDCFLTEGDVVPCRRPIGIYGQTGNASGLHLHLNVTPCEYYNKPLYPENGYKGRIDPMGFLITAGIHLEV